MICKAQPRPKNVVFLTDYRSVIQSLKSPGDQMEWDTQRLLYDLSQGANAAVQWFHAHCGLAENMEADRLAKQSWTLEQQNNRISYREAKNLLKREIRNWSHGTNRLWSLGYAPDTAVCAPTCTDWGCHTLWTARVRQVPIPQSTIPAILPSPPGPQESDTANWSHACWENLRVQIATEADNQLHLQLRPRDMRHLAMGNAEEEEVASIAVKRPCVSLTEKNDIWKTV